MTGLRRQLTRAEQNLQLSLMKVEGDRRDGAPGTKPQISLGVTYASTIRFRTAHRRSEVRRNDSAGRRSIGAHEANF